MLGIVIDECLSQFNNTYPWPGKGTCEKTDVHSLIGMSMFTFIIHIAYQRVRVIQ